MRWAAVAAVAVGAALVVAALATGGRDDDPPPRAPAVADAQPRGLAVWAAQGCGSCHTFAPANAQGVMGPDLALSLDGRSKEYIRTSIVAPDAEVAAGWSGGAMPPDFAERIAPEDLDALVDFLARR